MQPRHELLISKKENSTFYVPYSTFSTGPIV